MKVSKRDMLLYAVTDRSWLGAGMLENQVESIIKAGVTFVQLREKGLDFDSFLLSARRIKKVTDKYKIPFIINDNVDVALAADADGVHVGQRDMSAKEVRRVIGDGKILGVSVQTARQARIAVEGGADYIGAGAVFPTDTKGDADSVSLNALKEICSAVTVPVVAIGGINEGNILKLKGAGIDGVAVVSAIFAASDISAAAERLLTLAKEAFV